MDSSCFQPNFKWFERDAPAKSGAGQRPLSFRLWSQQVRNLKSLALTSGQLCQAWTAKRTMRKTIVSHCKHSIASERHDETQMTHYSTALKKALKKVQAPRSHKSLFVSSTKKPVKTKQTIANKFRRVLPPCHHQKQKFLMKVWSQNCYP